MNSDTHHELLPSQRDRRAAAQQAQDAPAFVATPKQQEFYNALFSGQYLYLALGGGIRGTKTWGVIGALILLCRIYPGSRWAVVRKDLPTLRRNTIPSINKMRAAAQNFIGELNQSTWSYRCQNGSEIILFPESISTDPDLDRWKGLEVNGFVLEEANEMAEKSAYKAIERAGSWIIPGTRSNPAPNQPLPFVLFTFNPCSNWPYFWFYEPHKAGNLEPPYFYLPSTAADNPYIPAAVREAWKNLNKRDYDRFVLGIWEFLDEPDQLIPTEWVLDARNVDPIVGPNRIGADPARQGDDASVICRVQGNALVGFLTFPRMKTTRFARIIAKEAVDPRMPVLPEDIRIDAVGVGGGSADTLDDEGFRGFLALEGGGAVWPRKGETFYKFRNFRSQMWWELRCKFERGEISLPEEIPPRLLSDLTAIQFKISADRVIEVEEKRFTKKRIGMSPDWGDSFAMAMMDAPEHKPRNKMIHGTISQRTMR